MGEVPLLGPFGSADVAFAASFEALHQEGQKLDGLIFVLINDDGFYLLLFRGRKYDLFVCHSFSPCLAVMKRRQAAPEEVVEEPTGPWVLGPSSPSCFSVG
jgi:hypothetical protein